MSEPSQKTLLYVINHIDWFWSHRLPLAKGAQEADWDVSVAVPHASQDQKLGEYNFQGIDLPSPDQGSSALALIKTIFELRRVLKRHRPHLVHTITLKYAFITGLASLGLNDIQFVHTIAGLGYLFSGEGMKPRILRAVLSPLLKLALCRPDIELIFQNPDDMAILQKRGLAVPERSHLIRGSGVDTNQFQPAQAPTPDQDKPLVVMPTRLVRDKGVSVFVEAARILKAKGLDIDFQIAGGLSKNNPLAMTEEEMSDLTEDGAVKWLGRVDDMPDLLARASLIAYPSHYREGIPKVLLESAAMGKAIITTDHAGCREAVAHKRNGLLVPVKDSQALADAIESLVFDAAKLSEYGQHSRQRALNEFDATIIVKQTLDVYG